jgi:thiamine-phosphate diphosphorylase
MKLRGVYPIVDVPDEGAAEGASRLAETLLGAGARILQLRAKRISDRTLLALARHLSDLCAASDARFILNDRVDLAVLSGAGGVHLGADDLPVVEARKLLPAGVWIGCSTDSPEEAAEAGRAGADYVAWGAVFPTKTKPDAHPQSGPDDLARVRRALSPEIPLVAIGGIHSGNIREAVQAGADACAVIGALASAENPASEFRQLQGAFQDS